LSAAAAAAAVVVANAREVPMASLVSESVALAGLPVGMKEPEKEAWVQQAVVGHSDVFEAAVHCHYSRYPLCWISLVVQRAAAAAVEASFAQALNWAVSSHPEATSAALAGSHSQVIDFA